MLALAPSLHGANIGMKTLTGHVPAVVRHLSVKKNLPDTNRLSLAIGLPLRDAKGLDAFLAQVYDPASPNYRHYLTVDQFTANYGPTEQDYAAVAAFARQNHLKVTATHPNRLVLDVSGSVADVQKALHITMHTYAHPTEARDFFAPDVDPTIDASLPVADICGLNDYILPHPKSMRQVSSATPRSGSASGGAYIGDDFRVAYLPGENLTGSGQMVGLLEFDGYYASDISSYENSAGYATVPLQTVLLDGYDGTPTTGKNSGNPEVSLDIEMAVAFAPGLSKIVLFETGPNGFQNDILNAMAASNQIKQLSCSWGWGGGPSATTDNIFKEMAAQGQSFFNAAGDGDAFTVGASSANGVDNPELANAPSSSPYITTVGATTLSTTGPKGSWESETVWNWGLQSSSETYVGTSGGVSSYYSIPSWQTGISMSANAGSTTFRNIPDVSLVGDNIYVAYGNGTSGAFGGTSCAAPLWAGLAAMMNEQAATTGAAPVGFINPAIYALAKGAKYSATFHDITTGNDESSSSPNNYSAVAGYDLCTGWGTPIGQNLIDAMVGAPDPLGVSPAGGFTAGGPIGGPFSPATRSVVLTNSGSAELSWSATTPNWLSATPSNGTLAAHGSTDVALGFTAAGANLAAGTYSSNVVFENVTSNSAQNLSFTLQVGQSLVQNGGFETGDFTGWTLTGNTVVGLGRRNETVYDAVEDGPSGYEVVHSGSYGAFLGDNAVATLAQTLPTVADETYLLSLWLDNPEAGSVQQFSVAWNGVTMTNLSNPPAFGWANLQFIVSATGNSSVLEFDAENDPSYFGLDDVSVLQVPRPALQSATAGPNRFSFTFGAVSGLRYQVQYKTDLSQANWTNLGLPTVAAGNSLSIIDTNGVAGSAQRFYRLAVAP